MNKKPNIVFLLTDDQRFDTIHALGNEEIKTPNMDYLVNHGTSFTNAHIPGGTSGAICMPSRAMINTGRTLFHLEREGQNIPCEHRTLGEILKEDGYFTFGTGKWHNGPPAFTRSFDYGENIFFGGMWDHWNVPTNYYDPTGEYDNVINFVGNAANSNKVTKVHCDKFNPGVHSSELLSKTTVEFIEGANREQPFFVYTAYLAPHDPRTMPEEYKNMYDIDSIKLPPNFTKDPVDFGVKNIRDEVLATYPRDERNIKEQIAEYYGMITHLDHEIGKVIDAVRRKGELENTIFILAGDNGLAMGCHGLMGKQNHYEHSIRIPLVFSGRGIPEGKKVDNYVYLLDIFPTICEMLGIDIPESVEGKSFYPMFTDDTYKTRENLYFAYNDLIRSVKTSKYKMIQYKKMENRCAVVEGESSSVEANKTTMPDYSSKIELFDLEKDPYEMQNIAAENPEIVEELTTVLYNFRDEWDDLGHDLGRKYWDDFKAEK
ncbi:MAG: sulfatase-like hydrolase/transferase [Eubacteriales bacterium]